MRAYRSRLFLIATALTAIFSLLAPSARSAQKLAGVSDPPHILSVSSLPNAAQLTPTLYRGAQPLPDGYAKLKEIGIDIVVDFRDENSQVKDEQARVQAAGMRFISIPWSAHSNPTRAQVMSFFSVLRDNPQNKVFVHCEAGADRTGTMVALYRVALDHWTPQQAIAEMKIFHFHSLYFPHLARYVGLFPSALEADPALLAGFAPQLSAQHP